MWCRVMVIGKALVVTSMAASRSYLEARQCLCTKGYHSTTGMEVPRLAYVGVKCQKVESSLSVYQHICR
jgi:hypothetical protein